MCYKIGEKLPAEGVCADLSHTYGLDKSHTLTSCDTCFKHKSGVACMKCDPGFKLKDQYSFDIADGQLCEKVTCKNNEFITSNGDCVDKSKCWDGINRHLK